MQAVIDEGLKYIERSAGIDTAAAAKDFMATIFRMGFHATACGAWAGIGKHRRHRFFFVKWPQDWLDLYDKNGWFEVDPLAGEARRRVAPFVLSEVDQTKFSEGQREFYQAAWDYGWRDAFSVPIHGPGSLQGLVSLATQREDFKLDTRSRAVLELMARTIWERCRVSEGFGISTSAPPKLSAREVECLQWAAVGKPDGEIAKLVGIKAATAHFHIERAKKKLAANTRV